MRERQRVSINDLPQHMAERLSDEDQLKISGGYLLWELKQARISSYSVSGASDGAPQQQILQAEPQHG